MKYLDLDFCTERRLMCQDCDKPFLISVGDILNDLRVQLTNTKFEPEECEKALQDAWPLPLSEIDDKAVVHYSTLMSEYRWTPSLIGQGGYLCPILFVNDRLLLGVNRFWAAVRANYTLFAATATLKEG
jgi:hypothetical protein